MTSWGHIPESLTLHDVLVLVCSQDPLFNPSPGRLVLCVLRCHIPALCPHLGKCWSAEDPSSFGQPGRFPSHSVCVTRGLPPPAWSLRPLICSSLSPGLLLACSMWVRATLGLGAEWRTDGLVVLTVLVFFTIHLFLFPFPGPNLAAPCILSRVYCCIRDSERVGGLTRSSLEQSSPIHLSMCMYMSSTCNTV